MQVVSLTGSGFWGQLLSDRQEVGKHRNKILLSWQHTMAHWKAFVENWAMLSYVKNGLTIRTPCIKSFMLITLTTAYDLCCWVQFIRQQLSYEHKGSRDRKCCGRVMSCVGSDSREFSKNVWYSIRCLLSMLWWFRFESLESFFLFLHFTFCTRWLPCIFLQPVNTAISQN